MSDSPDLLMDYLKREREISFEVLEEFLEKERQSADGLPEVYLSLLNRVREHATRGGKYGRPTLVRLANGLSSGNDEVSEEVLKVSCAVELYHRYILVHDDIIDRDLRRHGEPTLESYYSDNNSRKDKWYGLSMALVGGDMMHHLASRLVLRSGLANELTIEVLDGLNQCYLETVAGWVLEAELKQKSLDEVKREEIEKAMMLVSAHYSVLWPLRVGQLLAGVGFGNWNQALEDYGRNIGMAFQLQDDVLGLMGKPEKTGKPVGSDLKEGKKSLLLYFVYRGASKDERKFLEDLMYRMPDETELEKLQELIKEGGALEQVGQLRGEYVERAKEALDDLTHSHVLTRLEQLADFLADREY